MQQRNTGPETAQSYSLSRHRNIHQQKYTLPAQQLYIVPMYNTVWTLTYHLCILVANRDFKEFQPSFLPSHAGGQIWYCPRGSTCFPSYYQDIRGRRVPSTRHPLCLKKITLQLKFIQFKTKSAEQLKINILEPISPNLYYKHLYFPNKQRKSMALRINTPCWDAQKLTFSTKLMSGKPSTYKLLTSSKLWIQIMRAKTILRRDGNSFMY